MAYVGNVFCDYVHGWPQVAAERVSVWEVPGIDGYGGGLTGLGDSEFEVRAVRFALRDYVELWSRQVKLLQGSIVTLACDGNVYRQGCLIQHVSEVQLQAAAPYGCRGEVSVRGLVLP